MVDSRIARAAFLWLAVVLGGACSHPCGTELIARRYDSAMACLEPFAVVGCTDATSCDDSLTFALDGRGQCFFFPDLCLPAGFTAVNSTDARCPATSPTPPACAP